MKILKNNQNKQKYTNTILSSIYPLGMQFQTKITYIPDRRPGFPDTPNCACHRHLWAELCDPCNSHCRQCLRAVQFFPSLVPHNSEQAQDDSLSTVLTEMHQTQPKHFCLILYLNKSHICSSKMPEGRLTNFSSSYFCIWNNAKEFNIMPLTLTSYHVDSPLKFQKITLQSQALDRVREGLTICLWSCRSLQVKWLCNWIYLLYLIVGYLVIISILPNL